MVKWQPLKMSSQRNGFTLANIATTACLCLRCTKTRTQRRTNGRNTAYLDVLLRVLQVFKERFVPPNNSWIFVGTWVGVSLRLTGLTTKESMKIRSLLLSSPGFHSVTLRALGREDFGSLLFISVFLSHGDNDEFQINAIASLWTISYGLFFV